MKKIKVLATFVLMITILIILGAKAYATTGIIKGETVKLRKQPNSKTVLDYVYKGDEVEILELKDTWYKVKAETSLGKVTGYISKDEVDIEEEKTDKAEEIPVETPADTVTELPEIAETENKTYTLPQKISIKAVPLMSAREKAKISGTIEIIETINDWSRIESEIEIGWIRTSVLENTLTSIPIEEPKQEQPIAEEPKQEEQKPEKVEPTPEEPELNEIELNKIGYVNADGLRVRRGPSTDTEEITSFSRNHEVKIIGQIGNWYKIDLGEKTGYVSAKYISDTKVVETTSRGGTTLKSETPVVQEIPTVPEIQDTQSSPVIQEAPVSNTTGITGTVIVEFAKQYLGYKYVSGGVSPSTGFDCSGFTSYVYKQFGISLYRTSRDQIKNGVAIERSDLQPGDLVIFNNDANTKIGHVGIYIGDGNFIHASNPSDGVKITTLLSGYYNIRYVGARRVI